MISENEFKEWLEHPVTQAFRNALSAKRAGLRNEWEQSSPSEYMKEELILANVGNIGWCRGLAFAETLTFEQLVQELEDEE